MICTQKCICSSIGYVKVHVTNTNEPPSMGDSIRFVDEDASLGEDIGEPLKATDPDANVKFSFFIRSGNSESIFALESCNGQLSMNQEGTRSRLREERGLVFEPRKHPTSCL